MASKKKLILTDKKARLLKEIQKQVRQGKTPNITKAGKAAGYAQPGVSAHRAMKTLKMQLPDLLDSIGLDARTVLEGFHESLHATKVERHAFQGVVIDSFEDIDHAIRIRARELLTSYHYPKLHDDRVEPAAAGPVFNIHVGGLHSERTANLIERARERIGGGDLGQLRVDEQVDKKPRRSGLDNAVQTTEPPVPESGT